MKTKTNKSTVKKATKTSAPAAKPNLTKDLLSFGSTSLGSDKTKPVAIKTDVLKNHVLICGSTGSGKTNTCFNLLEQIWKQGIPFLVIEPAKSEYRHLFMNSGTLKFSAQIFTLGDDSASALRINPFEFGPGINVQSHIDALLAILNASFEMYTPMPQVLAKAIYMLYQARGWDLVANKNRRLAKDIKVGDANCPAGIFPTMRELYDSIEEVTESFGYSERIGPDVKAALKARIGTLINGSKGRAFCRQSSEQTHKLINGPCLLELGDKFNSCEKSFLTGVLMLFLYEHRRAMGPTNELKHVLLIEDAHRLLKKANKLADSSSSAFSPAVSEIFVHLLSEASSYGESIVISTQIPANLTPEILSNTNLKFIHRLLTEDDIKSVAPQGYLTEPQRKQIVNLETGDAIIIARGLQTQKPVKMQVNQYRSIGAKIGTKESNALLLEYFSKSTNQLQTAAFDVISSDMMNNSAATRSLIEICSMVANDEQFRTVFHNYVLSCLNDFNNLVHFRTQIIHEIQRVIGGRSEGTLTEITWCSLVLCCERYFERKGEINYWNFDEVEAQKSAWLSLMKPAFQPNYTNRRIDIEELKTWKNNLIEAHKREQGPFTSCGPCTSKCIYRFEVSELIRDPRIKFDFNSSINRTDTYAAEAAAMFCRLLCERLINNLDIDLAYCLAVQLIREQNLSSDAQLVLLHKVRAKLEDYRLEAEEAKENFKPHESDS